MAEIRLYHSTQLDNNEWQDLQALQRDALANTLDRSQEDIDTLVAWDDPDRFVASHVDPNTEVGRRFNYNQEYVRPMVAVASEAGEPIGFL